MSTLKKCERCDKVEPLEETEGWGIVSAKITDAIIDYCKPHRVKSEYAELCHDCMEALEKWIETPPPEKFLDPRLENEPK